MIAVAIVAIFLGVWVWTERRRARRALASWHDRQVVCVFKGFMGPDNEIIWEPTSRPIKMGDPPVSRRLQRISTWHRQLAQKYWRAARYRWLPVQPDP